MLSSSSAVSVRGVTKEYRTGQQRGSNSLSESISNAFRRSSTSASRSFRALDDVSFEIAAGTAVAIVGRNGAGKSTLLKILSRITRPTAGEVVLRGRVGALLEVGTGFHAELTGRENVFMNGAMLGMRRAEILRKFDEIIAFAEVERFLDTPVKRYSSGMYVRLAFAVAAHLEPEILLVDEVLAVGDAAFQKKCLGKMGDVAGEGRTVIFVSHNSTAVQQLTTDCILLESGSMIEHGPTAQVLARYLSGVASPTEVDLADASRFDSSHGQTARFLSARLTGVTAGGFAADKDPTLEVSIRICQSLPSLRISFIVFRFDGSPVGSAFGRDLQPPPVGIADYEVSLTGVRLAPGRYFLALAVGRGDPSSGFSNYDVVTESVHFEVLPPTASGGDTLAPWEQVWGPVRFDPPDVCLVHTQVRGH